MSHGLAIRHLESGLDSLAAEHQLASRTELDGDSVSAVVPRQHVWITSVVTPT